MYHLRSFFLHSALALSCLAFVACSSTTDTPSEEEELLDTPWIGGKADGYSSDRRYEVLFTNPHCDLCETADRDFLLANSKKIHRTVELIDGARSTIDVAQFTFSRREIEQALVRAHERGVRIRMGMDSGQNREGSASRRLLDAGISVRFVQGKPAGNYMGLQHNKYMIVDGATIMTGSNNWSSTGTSINNENTIVIGSGAGDPLVDGFVCNFQAIWDGLHDEAAACSNDTVAFTPSARAKSRIVAEVRASTQSIDVLMHHLTFTDLVKELARAAERGVRVRVVVNAADREAIKGSNWNRFFAAGGQIRYKLTNEAAFQIMHHKLAIIDDKLLFNGSGNWSGSAFFNNYENYIRYAEARVVDPFVEMFARIWRWSLTDESLDSGRSAALQHAEETKVFFGNLHAHIFAMDGDKILDDAKPTRDDAEGNEIPVDTGDTVAEATRFAFEYGRDRGKMDFLAITPHTVDDGPDLAPDVASMSVEGYRDIVETARAVTEESNGTYVALPGMEWSTNKSGNHVNILGSEAIAKERFGEFQDLYEKFLPRQKATGDRPILQFNHPRTFPRHEGQLRGPWDQIFDIYLTDITNNSDRAAKFNDYGLDDYPPMSEVRQGWIEGIEMPDREVVRATLENIEQVTRPYGRLMEVTLGRGMEIGHELGQNPSMVPEDYDSPELVRLTRVESDWDYYLLNGFLFAPTANHDNHRANWGTGHSSRTAVIAPKLTERDILDAILDRMVYASEDQNLVVRFYAEGRIAMGSSMGTLADRITVQLFLQDDDFEGPYDVTVHRGMIGGSSVEPVANILGLEGDVWHALDVSLPEAGRWFVYLSVHEVGPDRMAWTAPIWVERLTL